MHESYRWGLGHLVAAAGVLTGPVVVLRSSSCFSLAGGLRNELCFGYPVSGGGVFAAMLEIGWRGT